MQALAEIPGNSSGQQTQSIPDSDMLSRSPGWNGRSGILIRWSARVYHLGRQHFLQKYTHTPIQYIHPEKLTAATRLVHTWNHNLVWHTHSHTQTSYYGHRQKRINRCVAYSFILDYVSIELHYIDTNDKKVAQCLYSKCLQEFVFCWSDSRMHRDPLPKCCVVVVCTLQTASTEHTDLEFAWTPARMPGRLHPCSARSHAHAAQEAGPGALTKPCRFSHSDQNAEEEMQQSSNPHTDDPQAAVFTPKLLSRNHVGHQWH